jgi:hypothetical protein
MAAGNTPHPLPWKQPISSQRDENQDAHHHFRLAMSTAVNRNQFHLTFTARVPRELRRPSASHSFPVCL